MSPPKKIEIAPDVEGLRRRAAEYFTETALRAFGGGEGTFSVALSGGATPKGVYELLAREPFKSRLPWARMHFFWGDERNVAPDDKDSNFGMAWEAWLKHVPVPAENIHRFQTDGNADPAATARDYETALKKFFNLSGAQVLPRFNLVMLGLGPDGHTASLFPDVPETFGSGQLVIAPWVPHLNSYRFSLSSEVINAADDVLFIVSGPEKAEIVSKVLSASMKAGHYPANRIHPASGPLTWLLDRAAASRLEP